LRPLLPPILRFRCLSRAKSQCFLVGQYLSHRPNRSYSSVLTLVNPPLISSTFHFFIVWVSLITASNEKSTLFMAFLDAYMLTSAQLLYLRGVWTMSWRSAILIVAIEEQPRTFNPDLSTKLVYWNQSADCCLWEGVNCAEGRVIGLDLTNESISGGLDNLSSLFNLSYLQSLNLAYNNFNGSQISSEFDKLTNLSYLNLSNAGFEGKYQLNFTLDKVGYS
jgi:hypothetical protein